MYRQSAVVLSVFVSTVWAGWMQDLTESGLHFNNGLSVHLDEIRNENSSSLERHELRLDYSGIGIGLSKMPDKNKLEVGIYYSDIEEGRGKKMGEMIVPILAGFKVVAVGVIMMAAVGGLVLQSLIAAKLSFAVSTILAISKLFGKQPHAKQIKHYRPHVKYQELPPIEIPATFNAPSHSEFNSVAPASFDGYANYPSPVHEFADSRTQSEVVAVPDMNDNKQQVINLDEQPVGLNRRKYSTRSFNNINRNTRVEKQYV